MTTKEILTGWCEHSFEDYPHLHKVCHGTYTGRGQVTEGKVQTYTEITYICSCACHTSVSVNGQMPVRKIQRRPPAPPVKYIQRRR